jgi:hypothetical protein
MGGPPPRKASPVRQTIAALPYPAASKIAGNGAVISTAQHRAPPSAPDSRRRLKLASVEVVRNSSYMRLHREREHKASLSRSCAHSRRRDHLYVRSWNRIVRLPDPSVRRLNIRSPPTSAIFPRSSGAAWERAPLAWGAPRPARGVSLSRADLTRAPTSARSNILVWWTSGSQRSE